MISSQLVTVRGIAEMQQRNAELLEVTRDLSAQLESRETQVRLSVSGI